jgi:peptidyl-prolyl cis-trans isomerase B (cyclophilin B)
LAVISLLAAVGCQRGGSGQPAASVPGPNGQKAGPGGSASAGAKQDAAHPLVVVETSLGSFTVRLDADKAPLTVDNFLRYVAAKHYDGTIFHQVQKSYPKVVLGGAFTTDLKERPTRIPPVRNEADNGAKNRRGTIAMARQPDVIDSATAMFFINLSDNDILDYKDRTPEHYGYCVFGEVTEGLDVVEGIAQAPLRETQGGQSTPIDVIAIKSIQRLR